MTSMMPSWALWMKDFKEIGAVPGFGMLDDSVPAFGGRGVSLPLFEGRARAYLLEVSFLEEAEAFSWALSEVPPCRREKVERFKNSAAARLSLGAGLVLAEGLRGLGLTGAQELSLGTWGKPYLSNQPGLFFNLSHSGSQVLGLFSDREVGCDVQERSTFREGVVRRFFHPEEVAFLFALPPGRDRDEAFTKIWALKESFIKMDGRGMACPLDSFCVRLGEPPVLATGSVAPAELDCRMEGDYALAFCRGK